MPSDCADNVRDNESKDAVEEEEQEDYDDDDGYKFEKKDPTGPLELLVKKKECTYQLKPWVSPFGPPKLKFTIFQ
jgi:hypothetical protein